MVLHRRHDAGAWPPAPLQLALVREQQAAGGAVGLHAFEGDHSFPLTHATGSLLGAELVAPK